MAELILNCEDGYPGIYSFIGEYDIRKKVATKKKEIIKTDITITLNLDRLMKNCSSKVFSSSTTNLYLLKSLDIILSFLLLLFSIIIR